MTVFSALLIGNETLTHQCGAALLARGYRIAAVVSRHGEVRKWAAGAGLRVVNPGDWAALDGLSVDWLLSVANLSVIPEAVLGLASRGAVNFHDGPLPAHAGLNAPVWALLAGEARHGIAWHLIAGGGGEGDVLEARSFDIAPNGNALTLDTLEDLVATARELTSNRTLRGVVIAGEGDSFCAGLDFATVLKNPPRVARSFVPNPWRGTTLFQEACWAWRRVPVRVVAAVHGHCYGGGLQIALAADLRMTTADAQWSVLEAKWGLVPDMSGIQALSQQVRMDVAKRLTMTGEVVSGERAVDLGLASELHADPVAAATAFVEQVATRSPDAVAATKRLFGRTWSSSDRRTFARERIEQAKLLATKNTTIAREAAMKRAVPVFDPRRR